jgi:indolepyruvate ferredoxin oxidoreductase, alpha subunit
MATTPQVLPLLGNEAVGRGLVEAGCHLVLGYPGTPSSEILPAAMRFAAREKVHVYSEWCANEKVALEQALAASYTGKRTSVIMKQVGLNVAADPLMSAAYIGVVGGLVLVIADDPGPTSSQTEQDTRQFAHFAKVPVLDPSTPEEARQMVAFGFELSEKHQTPVIVRLGVRICHGRQDIPLHDVAVITRPANFQREPSRWAATPRHRYVQHLRLNERLKTIASEFEQCQFNELVNSEAKSDFAIIAAGNPFSVVIDLLQFHGLDKAIPVLKVGAPFPFPRRLVEDFVSTHKTVVVIEETDQLIELLINDRRIILGRHNGVVPDAGELDATVIGKLLSQLLLERGIIDSPWEFGGEAIALRDKQQLPVLPPTLCAGCPHRASFYAIRKAGGKQGIYPSDIGCYTLGVNMGGVDTCHDMGAAVSMAAGFYQAYAHDGLKGKALPPIIATIGDSTFYHGGLSPLANAAYADARFTLVILDNHITAMTGMQPPLASGILVNGDKGHELSIKDTCRGLGVRWVEVVDPFEFKKMRQALREAIAFNRDPEGGVAVLIARRPCIINQRDSIELQPVMIDSERCNLCNLCIDQFGCPALVNTGSTIEIDRALCIDCGACVHACARNAIRGCGGTP